MLVLFSCGDRLGRVPIWSLTPSNVTIQLEAEGQGIMALILFAGAYDTTDVLKGYALKKDWHVLRHETDGLLM